MDEFREIKKETEPQIDRLVREHMQLGTQNSDHQKYIDFGFNILKNLTYYYNNSAVKIKQAIIGSIFSEKLIFENNGYRTTKVIEAVSCIYQIIKELQGDKKITGSEICSQSYMVHPRGFEPLTLRAEI